MAMNQFPPQAYTRDMLATAYEWLRGQPTSVRELAKDSDSLVALYMQARRRSEHKSDVVASSESFKQDLKNLAEGLKQFDEPGLAAGMPQQILPSQSQPVITPPQVFTPPQMASPRQHTPNSQAVHVPHATPTTMHASSHSQAQAASHSPSHSQVHHSVTHAPQHYSTHQQAPTMSQGSNPLDHITRDKIRSVQLRMNLSSETEALRMLVAIGYEQLSQWLPKS